MNPVNKKQEIHYIVAHRDDAALTFYSRITRYQAQGLTQTVHIIFNDDPNIRGNFEVNLNEYTNRLSSELGLTKFIRDKYLKRNKNDYSILARFLEETMVSRQLRVNLVEYYLPCGYPLRGYKYFNSQTSDQYMDDKAQQLRKILTTQSTNLKRKIQYEGELKDLFERISYNQSIHFELHFLSGVGGHPDHQIIAQLGQYIKQLKLINLAVTYGCDQPYSMVKDWYRLSPLPLKSLTRSVETFDVSKKIALLKSYKTQFDEEELEAIRQYNLINGEAYYV